MCNCCFNYYFIFKMTVGFCNECNHPCHCGEEKDLHADEYGVCSCEGCECKDSKIVKKEKNEI